MAEPGSLKEAASGLLESARHLSAQEREALRVLEETGSVSPPQVAYELAVLPSEAGETLEHLREMGLVIANGGSGGEPVVREEKAETFTLSETGHVAASAAYLLAAGKG